MSSQRNRPVDRGGPSPRSVVGPESSGSLSANLPPPNVALTAVAFQDHLMKGLSLGTPPKPRTQSLQSQLRYKKPKAKSVVDTGLKKSSHGNKSVPDEQEYVIDAKKPSLSLAQKFGLVPCGDQPLTQNEWSEVKEKSRNRDDSSQPCVICKEHFGVQQQIILSCSHVFHRSCLEAFERFTGRKTCPMCRKEEYEKRVIFDGAKQFRVKATIRIQTCWRGFVVRRWYRRLRATVPPKDPLLRKKFYEDKLAEITDRLIHNGPANDIDRFLSDIDQSVAASRDVFRRVDRLDQFKQLTNHDWEQIQLKAVDRAETDCPICIMPLNCLASHDLSSSDGASRAWNSATTRRHRETVLLSCSHVFHAACVEAFEELTLGERRVCPVCRSLYQKNVFSI